MADEDKKGDSLHEGKTAAGMQIVENKNRALIDDLLIKGMPINRIVRYMAAMYNDLITEKTLRSYRDNYFNSDKGIVAQIIKATHELSDKALPEGSDRELVAGYFSISQTNEDIKSLYDRIKVLRAFADKYPFDESYDKRISEYTALIERVKDRVYKQQYEQIRKAIILNIGKKICLAAINIFLPYIEADKRKDVVTRFENVIKPMLDLKVDDPFGAEKERQEIEAQATQENAGEISLDQEAPDGGQGAS